MRREEICQRQALPPGEGREVSQQTQWCGDDLVDSVAQREEEDSSGGHKGIDGHPAEAQRRGRAPGSRSKEEVVSALVSMAVVTS
jgi:hypothetical protein